MTECNGVFHLGTRRVWEFAYERRLDDDDDDDEHTGVVVPSPCIRQTDMREEEDHDTLYGTLHS